MNMRTRAIGLTVVLSLLVPVTGIAATYFVDAENGNDGNSGLNETAAFRSVGRVNSLSLSGGDSVLFRRGQVFDGELDVNDDGTAPQPIVVGAWGSGSRPTLYQIDLRGDYVVVQDIDVDHRKDASDAIRIRSARNNVLRNMEIRNGTRDAVDVNRGDGLLIEDVEIHHFLNGSFGSKDDSHGVAITDTDGVTIRRANIHHVSGDSVQSDPNRVPGGISDNNVVEDSVLWTGALEQDFNSGWSAGDSPGENALDTKVLISGYENEIRMNVTFRNVTAYGWVDVAEISNRAAFNLKEKISATFDRITVYDSEIAFRIRGSLGAAETLISNTVIYDVDTAIRAEDNTRDLRVYHSTFGNGIGIQLDVVSGGAGVASWDLRNNAFLGSKPSQADHPTNVAVSAGDFVDAGNRDYRIVATSDLIDAADVIAGISVDRNGVARTAPYDSGAYEFGSSGTRPKPPVLDAAE